MGKVIKKSSDFGKVSVKAPSSYENWAQVYCSALALRCVWRFMLKTEKPVWALVGFSSAILLERVTSLDLFCMGR